MLDHRQLPFLSSLAVATMIAGCITVHVYFPVKELSEAADEIVDDVRPDIVSAEDSADSSSESESESGERAGDSREDALHLYRRARGADGFSEHVRAPSSTLALLSVSLVSTAWADEKDTGEKGDDVINASSPRIKKIKVTLKARYKQLLPLYVAGRIGEGQNGYVALRDVKDLKLKDRRKVSTLVKAENADRKRLYTTIARENEIADSKIKDIGRLFGRSWQKKSKTGWWIEVKKGKWVKKPKPEKRGKPSGAEKPKSAA